MKEPLTNRLIAFLCSIPALQEPGARGLLLRGLPEGPASAIPRSDTPRVALAAIVDAASRLG